MNTDHDRARAKWRSSELNVQNIHGMFAQFSTQSQRNSNQRCVWKGFANFEIGPALVETIASFCGRNVNSVLIDAVNLRQRFDEIDGVAFVSPKLRPNRMSIDCDPQSCNPVVICP